jgi:Tol biopolymer transport system component
LPDGYDLESDWSAATGVDHLNSTYAEDDATLTGDLLEIYFSSDRPDANNDGKNIYKATRTSPTAEWSTPAIVDELTSDQHDDTPEISLDGLRMYYTRYPAGSVETIYFTSRTSRTEPWADPPLVVPSLNSLSEQQAPVIVAGGTKGYFCTTRPDDGDEDIYVATFTGSGFSTPARQAALSSSSDDCSIWVDMSDTLAIVSSDRGGAGRDLWWSWRPTPEDLFPAPIRLDALSGALGDEDPWLSPDGRTIFFTRGSASNGREIVMATR